MVIARGHKSLCERANKTNANTNTNIQMWPDKQRAIRQDSLRALTTRRHNVRGSSGVVLVNFFRLQRQEAEADTDDLEGKLKSSKVTGR